MARADKDLLAMALIGYEAEKSKVEAAIRDIQTQLGHRGRPKATSDGAAVPAKRVLSASARRKIAAAQKKRWAALKQAEEPEPAKKKRRMSAAGRARIVAATKKRWAEFRKKKATVGKKDAA